MPVQQGKDPGYPKTQMLKKEPAFKMGFQDAASVVGLLLPQIVSCFYFAKLSNNPLVERGGTPIPRARIQNFVHGVGDAYIVTHWALFLLNQADVG